MKQNRRNNGWSEGAAARVLDDRDATIAHLERAISDERKHSAVLRLTVDELRFKTELLEKSYAKQLEDARIRAETAERELTDQQERITALENAREEATQLLAKTRAELERISVERDQPREDPVLTDAPVKTAGPNDTEPMASTPTIDELLEDWSVKGDQRSDNQRNEPPEIPPEVESPLEEMIAPELVFLDMGDHDP